jgi:hypothetical protein
VESRFDIDRFMAQSGPLMLDDIAWDEVPRHPLTPETMRVLRYFLSTESATFYYLRSVMATKPALEEPEIAPFLCAWNYEEEFHGRAFARFVRAYGETVDDDYRAQMFKSRGRGEHIDEIGQLILSRIFPRAWPAAHMVWGAIQELTTYTAYTRLIRRVHHPILETICRRIMKQELRHFSFYYHQAHARLAASRVAREVTTRGLKFAWTPVGDGMSRKSEVIHAIQFLFDGTEGDAIAGIEKRVRELPGLEWFDMLSQYAIDNRIGRAPAEWFPTKAPSAGSNGIGNDATDVEALTAALG